MKQILLSLVLIIVLNGCTNKKEFIKLPSIISDNMVLQRNSNVEIWGWSNPGANINIEPSWGKSVYIGANDRGFWNSKIMTPDAGGPYVLSISSADTNINIKNVMVGEVWLCSGQSNMEMPLEGWGADSVANSKQEIENSSISQLRLFTVEKNLALIPLNDVNGKWEESNPNTASGFSATAFFFGKKLVNELNVPIGLIHSSWGGTPVESWISGKELINTSDFNKTVKLLNVELGKIKELDEWRKQFPIIDVSSRQGENKWKDLNFDDKDLMNKDFDDSSWKTMKLPSNWEKTEVGAFDGVVWFRKNVTIPKNWVGKDLMLELGPIDDFDLTYINGEKIGGLETAGNWNVDRVYKIPSEIVKNTQLHIAVRVIDIQGGGGIYGKAEKLKITSKTHKGEVKLSGDWKFLPVAEWKNGKFYVYGNKKAYEKRPILPVDVNSNTPTVLYNAMIAPLIPFNIKGAIWYQGESNVGRAKQYKEIFPMMIENWRKDWQIGDFSFYYVQIAPWRYGKGANSQKLREAQFSTLKVENTGMAVTLDIGNLNTIHPSNKQDVGKRLALWALAKDYKKAVNFSGPQFKSINIDKNKIIVNFDYSEGLELRKVKNGAIFEIASSNRKYKKARVRISNNKLILSNPSINHPVNVRYAWSDTAIATLFNKDGLPASSFRSDNWD